MIQRKPKLRTRQPDLIYVNVSRRLILSDQIEGGPDLVVEILSPGDTRRQLSAKLQDYCKIGVCECWLVSLEAETIEVLRLAAKTINRHGLYGVGDVLRSRALPGLELQTGKLFV